MDNRRQLLGGRIRDARVRLSLTQDTLAREAGFSSAQIISQIEKGERDLKALELFNVAKALFLDVSQLITDELEPPTPVLWRESPSDNKELIEAEFLKRCRQYALVERLCNCSAERSLPAQRLRLKTMKYSDANALGERTWAQLELGNRPACGLTSLLEDAFGVKIWYKNLGEDGSAASTIGTFGPAMLINSQEAPWRRNFSIGHELFHLITWESTSAGGAPDERVEKLANAFASALLLPSAAVREAFQPRIKDGSIGNVDLIEVARQFDVSTSALVYRLINLGAADPTGLQALLDDTAFRSLDKTSRIGRWLQPPTMPERFVRLAFLAYQRGNLSRPRLAEFLNASLTEVRDVLEEYGLSEDFDYKAEVRAS